VSDAPDILKYFHEEPALLEPVTPDDDPDARRRDDRSELPEGVSVPLEDLLDTRDVYRGYLAGTNHADDRVGLTTLRADNAYVPPLMKALGRSGWVPLYDPEHGGNAPPRRGAARPQGPGPYHPARNRRRPGRYGTDHRRGG